MRSSPVPPKTIAPSRPEPIGSASSHFAAGCAYESFRSAADAMDGASARISSARIRMKRTSSMCQREPDRHLRLAPVVPREVGDEDEVKLLRLTGRGVEVAIELV